MINNLVYKLYQLTYDEVKIYENHQSTTKLNHPVMDWVKYFGTVFGKVTITALSRLRNHHRFTRGEYEIIKHLTFSN